jgi:hypothetical protein
MSKKGHRARNLNVPPIPLEMNGQHPVVGPGEAIAVPVVTLDAFIAAGGPAPELVKIDVEGGEYEVLPGGSTVFTKQRPLVILSSIISKQPIRLTLGWETTAIVRNGTSQRRIFHALCSLGPLNVTEAPQCG